MADACPSPFSQSPAQVSLPPSVEHLISKIRNDQNQPPLKLHARRELASIGEPKALEILNKIASQTIKKSFTGYVLFLIKIAASADSPGDRPRISPIRLLMNTQDDSVVRTPTPTPTPTHVVEGSKERAAVSPQLEALGELEFRKAFIILSYIGGRKLEEMTTAHRIREFKTLPMRLFEVEAWKRFGSVCDYIAEKDRRNYIDWDCGKTHIYHCYLSTDGSYRFKGPYLTNASNFLQRTLGDDNVLMVKFAEEVTAEKNSLSISDYCSMYNKVLNEGISVGLRRYRFFVFKDGGRGEKKKDPTTSPVKCFFVRMESNASIDNQDYILSGKTIRKARSIFMHVDSLSSLSSYMARFSLILSKTMNLGVDLSSVEVVKIADILCQDKDGNNVYGRDGKPLILTDGTGYISEDLALKCPKKVVKGMCIGAENLERLRGNCEFKEKFSEMRFPESHCREPPLLIQFRLFNKGSAVKGTFLVNKKLNSGTVHIRPSMIKVETDPKLSNISTKNSLEIVGTSNQPKRACLSRNLISLLSYGRVPKEFFMDLLNNSLKDAQSVISNKRAALRALNYGELDDFIAATMIGCGIPLEESYLQYHLSILAKEEKKSLKGGKLPVPDSYYLMGTVDPTGLLEIDEVCIILDNGHVSGKVLVYRNPGLHFGDIHILKATYVENMEDFVGSSKYAIFFPRKGPRSLADEIAGGDYDGDMYFVSRNPQLLERFEQSEPWTSSSLTYNAPNKEPSEFTDEELENELFKLFLTTRFQPSYSVGLAADSWLVMMDRLLTLRDDCTAEKDLLKRNMYELIDIYYYALDAPKMGGRKIEVPKELKPDLFPHFMERKEEISYKSTSILGLIYDTVKAYEEAEISTNEVWKLDCFDIKDVPESCLTKWKELYEQYRSDMHAALEESKEAADEVIKKYKEILYEAPEFDQSKRNEKDIFDEACVIYHVAYDYAKSQGLARYCKFVWRVAGLALCKLYIIRNEKRPTMFCSPYTLKEIFG